MDCLNWPELSGSEWGERTLAPIKGQRYPLSGGIDLTERCNLSCRHCYIRQPISSHSALATEMNTATVKNIIDQIADAGCMFLLLTGGEILVRPDFMEIYMHAKRTGMLLPLCTHGPLVTKDLAKQLGNYPPAIIEITLYGASEETYAAVTGVNGMFERVVTGLNLLLAQGLKVMLKTVLTRKNVHDLGKMKQMADTYQLSFRYDGTLWPRLDGRCDPCNERIPVDQLLELDKKDPERRQQWVDLLNESSKQFVRSEYVYNCGAGFRSFHVTATGKGTMCIMSRYPAYDLSKISFSDAWKKMGDERRRKRSVEVECEHCPLGAFCSQCPGWSHAVHGDLETPVDYVCGITKLRLANIINSVIIEQVGGEDIL